MFWRLPQNSFASSIRLQPFFGRKYKNLEVKKNNFSPSSEKYLGSRVFVQKTTSKRIFLSAVQDMNTRLLSVNLDFDIFQTCESRF